MPSLSLKQVQELALPPDIAEVAQSRGMREVDEALSAKIATLLNSLDSASNEDDPDASAKLILFRGLLGSLRKLPPEVLEVVFLKFLELKDDIVAQEKSTGQDFNGAVPSPLILSQVCTTWRELTSNCASLWKPQTVWVRTAEKGSVLRNKYPETMEASLHQLDQGVPGSLRLMIYLSIDKGRDPEQTDGNIEPLRLPFPPLILDRVAYLDIHGDSAHTGLQTTTLKNVKCLRLEATKGEMECLTLPQLPALERVMAAGVGPQRLSAHIPMDQITHMELGNDMYMQAVRHALKDHPSFANAFITKEPLGGTGTVGVGWMFPEPSGTVYMPALKKMTILGQSLFYGNHLWEFSWPNLTHLQLDAESTPWHPNSIALFKSLTHIHLSSWDGLRISTQTSPIIYECKMLVSFVLNSSANRIKFEELFTLLTFEEEHPRLPLLEELAIHCTPVRAPLPNSEWGTWPNLPLPFLTRMLSSRCSQTGRGLKQIVLRFDSKFHEVASEVKDALIPFEDRLKVSVIQDGYRDGTFRGLVPYRQCAISLLYGGWQGGGWKNRKVSYLWGTTGDDGHLEHTEVYGWVKFTITLHDGTHMASLDLENGDTVMLPSRVLSFVD